MSEDNDRIESDFVDVDEEQPAPEPEWDPLGHERRAFQRFVVLTKDKRDLESRLDQTKEQLEALGLQLRDYLGAGGYDRVRIDGYTIFVRRQIWARKNEWVRTDDVVRALRANGLGHFVRDQIVTASLSKHVRELEEQHAAEFNSGRYKTVAELLPADLARVLNVEPSYQVIAQHHG